MPRFNGAILFCSVPDNDMLYDGVALESGIPIVLDFDKPEQVVMFDFVARAAGIKSPLDFIGQEGEGTQELKNVWCKKKIFFLLPLFFQFSPPF